MLSVSCFSCGGYESCIRYLSPVYTTHIANDLYSSISKPFVETQNIGVINVEHFFIQNANKPRAVMKQAMTALQGMTDVKNYQ